MSKVILTRLAHYHESKIMEAEHPIPRNKFFQGEYLTPPRVGKVFMLVTSSGGFLFQSTEVIRCFPQNVKKGSDCIFITRNSVYLLEHQS